MAKIQVWSKERGWKTLKEGVTLEAYRERYPSVIDLTGKKAPSIRTMEKWVSNGVAKAIDGCTVEPDGVCEHGCPSWILIFGLI